MSYFTIYSRTTSQSLGIYEAADEAYAIQEMLDLAGCDDGDAADFVAVEVDLLFTSTGRDEAARRLAQYLGDDATEDEGYAALRLLDREDLIVDVGTHVTVYCQPDRELACEIA